MISRPALCIAVYIAVWPAILLPLAACLGWNEFALPLISLVPFASMLITLPMPAENAGEHLRNISLCQLTAAGLVVVIVLAVLLGDAPDFSDLGGTKRKNRLNPYEFFENQR